MLEAPREVVHDQAFNVGGHDENYRISEVAEIVEADRARQPGAATPRAEAPTRAATGSTATSCRRSFPAIRPAWTVRRGVEELYEAYRAPRRSTLESSKSSRFLRLKRVRELQEQGMLDEQLRRRETAHESAGA